MTQSANGPKTLFATTTVTDYTTPTSGVGGNTGLKGDIEGAGTIRQEGDKFYRWVYNAHTSALVAGQAVCYDITNAEAFHERVILPTAASLNTFAGIAMSAIPTLGWGWIEIEGYYASCIVSIGKTSIAAGINCFPADTVSYLVGGAQQSATVNSVSNQMVGRVQLLASIASSSNSGAGTDAGTTAVAGWIHCLTA